MSEPRRVHVERDLADGAAYPLLNRLVVPRPIAWVSSRSAAGVDNLAPHSFFTVACSDPAVVSFTSVGHKDTLRNVRETGEFVVNLAPAGLVEQINATSAPYPPELSEFDEVGLTRLASQIVVPPSVAESPAAIECVLERTVEFGEAPRGSVVCFGRVVAITVEARVYGDRGPDIGLLDPISRLGGIEWGRVGEVSARQRPGYPPAEQ
ncbi:MAG: flavin reductase family protein [Nocardioides sp.]|uniref:flavin reductase family protein n=1 Tax=Nocardioides sp. TaxID=35761 RepID=UPI0039E58AFD